ncbi:MAG TPA: ABC transporter permease [Actinomycetota bacterium]|nr:ABC transporter permease [Actinomycetota bacterium]
MDQVIEWFRTAGNIPEEIVRHLYLAFVPVAGAVLITLPVGLYIGHKRRFEFLAVTVANLGRAIPSFAILSLFLPFSISAGLGLGFWPTFAALFVLSIPPILINTYVGVKEVDADTIEAARGVGFSEFQVLSRIELPLAAPLLIAGIRTAAVQSVATATLGALVAAGGLGDPIVLGFRTGSIGPLVGGAVLVASLAFATEIGLGWIERLMTPKAMSYRPSRDRPLRNVSEVARPPIGPAG